MGKKYQLVAKTIEKNKLYSLDEGINLALNTAIVKFDSTVEIYMRLGVDPKHADQIVRGTVVLPNGTGKVPKILVFAKGEKEKEAQEAGANFVGSADLIEKIEKENWLDFDVTIATPDIMKEVSKLGKLLGPRGLMPSPKMGTVTFKLKETIEQIKLGRVEYRVDKEGAIHCGIGKVSFGDQKIKENFLSIFNAVIKSKPASTKGQYLKGIGITTTMGPGIKIDSASILKQ
ncbi:MAG: 50S ribosomal protein L1 [bacterium]